MFNWCDAGLVLKQDWWLLWCLVDGDTVHGLVIISVPSNFKYHEDTRKWHSQLIAGLKMCSLSKCSAEALARNQVICLRFTNVHKCHNGWQIAVSRKQLNFKHYAFNVLCSEKYIIPGSLFDKSVYSLLYNESASQYVCQYWILKEEYVWLHCAVTLWETFPIHSCISSISL